MRTAVKSSHPRAAPRPDTADASDLDHGIRQVDEMLYRAKQNGRNRVEYNGDIKY